MEKAHKQIKTNNKNMLALKKEFESYTENNTYEDQWLAQYIRHNEDKKELNTAFDLHIQELERENLKVKAVRQKGNELSRILDNIKKGIIQDQED